MIFYLCNGDQLAGTQADAKALDPSFTQVDIPTDKAGLMAYVNELLATPKSEPVPPPPPPAPVQIPPSYTEVSIKIDEVFENLPLSQQLHLAALALENARKKCPSA